MSFALQNLEYRDDISESTFDLLNIRVPTRGENPRYYSPSVFLPF
jgi:hypothetical protein